MTFDGPVEEYLHEAAMMGHNGPPPIVKLTDSIILALMRAVMRRRDLGSLDKAVRWATLLSLDEDGVSMTSVKKLSEAVGYGRQASVRQARDRMVGDGFQEVVGPRSVRGVKVSLEDEITTYCDKVRPSSDCTMSPSSDCTRLPGSDRTRSVLPGSDSTRLPGSNGTTSSRTRVSYTGNIKNIPLPRDHAREDWRSFVLVDGNLEITDVGRRYWMDRGMDEARIELELIQADGKLTDYDRKTPDGVEKKAGLFFARSLQETIDKDKRYEAAVSRKETEKPKKISRSAQEALEKRKKFMEERGEQ